MSLLQCQQIRKEFNKNPVLADVSFSAEKGEIVALLGSSGAGKSTLLRCLNLLTQPDSGSLTLGKLKLHFNPKQKSALSAGELSKLRSLVGMVFQQYHLWPHRTVIDNLTLAPMKVLKHSQAQAVKNAQQWLNNLGLADKQDCYPSQLSGGQQQRVAICRALMMQPEVLLLDEPTAALDPKTMSELAQLLRTLANQGTTLIISTHEMEFARQTADKIIFLDQGRIAEQGPTQTLLSNPQSEKLKTFIETPGDIS